MIPWPCVALLAAGWIATQCGFWLLWSAHRDLRRKWEAREEHFRETTEKVERELTTGNTGGLAR